MHARTDTGLMCPYAIGIGSTKPNFECAKERLRQSADQEDPKAQLALLEIYDRGLGGHLTLLRRRSGRMHISITP
jgi:hypothetical protein